MAHRRLVSIELTPAREIPALAARSSWDQPLAVRTLNAIREFSFLEYTWNTSGSNASAVKMFSPATSVLPPTQS